MYQIIPNSSYTIGDLITCEAQGTSDPRDKWTKLKGRITNSWQNDMMIDVIELWNGEEVSHISYPLDGPNKILIRHVDVIEKGPWHNFICGEE